jgi:Fe-S-cluster formation regulator IscX/YfhJ
MDRIYGDDTYAIALVLIESHPGIDPLTIDWETLHRRAVAWPDFAA